MQITVNGKALTLADGGLTIARLLKLQGYCGETFAVALNGNFVPRARYAEVPLAEDDRLDIVAPVVGG